MPLDLSTVLKAKAGDNEAAGDLCRRLSRLIQHLASKAKLPPPSGNMMQEAYLAVLEVLPRFDPERGASFETFAAPYIRAALRKGKKEDEPLPGTGHYSRRQPEMDPLEILIAEERSYCPDVGPSDLSCLTDRQRLVVERTFGIAREERCTKEIAAELGLTERRVQQILAEALERLRQVTPEPE